MEYAWTDRISIKSETLYASFPDRTMSTVVSFPAAFVATGFFPPADTKSFTHSDSVWVSKIGIEFKLDSVPLDTK